jgi:hypothetical protein
MSTTAQLYALSIDQVVNAILVGGSKRTVLVQGHMGTGKSSILKILAKKLPDHAPCYFDCTTKDLGDISLPNLKTLDAGDFVSFVPNEELGLHLGRPVIIMIDELGKANPAVKNALLRLMLEHKLGNHTLPEGSIVFATTNLGAEGVGDLLPPHARNRITVVSMRKPTNIEHIEYGINNGFDPTLLAWEKDNPQLFATFETIKDPEENPYIYHPRAQRAAFVTPRSLEAASDWLKQRENFDDQTLTSLLIGTIGDRGAMDLMAFVHLADQMPSLDSIKNSPTTARVPDSAGAVCMVVYRALSTLERNWIDPWMDYLVRLDKEAQGLFANGVRNPKYSKQSMVMTNKKFTDWALQNNYMFTADKK